MILYKQFTFDAAHYLPSVPDGHKCKRLHGHTYHLTVFVEGEPNEVSGWIIDFNELTAIVKPIIDELDHQMLNDVPGLKNPTSEHLAIWIWKHIKPKLSILKRVELKETPSTGVIYEGM